jgi:hypothetical protein
MSFYYWSLAIERGHLRAGDIFRAAYLNSCNLPGAEEFWHSYSVGNPQFLLLYSNLVKGEDRSRAAFDEWWRQRGSAATTLEWWEPLDFYGAERRWGNPAQLEIWRSRHRDLERADYKAWAEILHEWKLDGEAWRILSRHTREPSFPNSLASQGGATTGLENRWRENPEDPVIAQTYAEQCSQRGDAARSEQVILSVAAGKNPPLWFVQKAAFLYAAKKDYTTAVGVLLRTSPAG